MHPHIPHKIKESLDVLGVGAFRHCFESTLMSRDKNYQPVVVKVKEDSR